MQRNAFLQVLIWLACLTTAPAQAQLLSAEIFDKVMKATELAYADHLLESLDEFNRIQQEIPDHPVGYFYEIAVLEKMQCDYMNEHRENDFEKMFKTAFTVAEKFILDHPQDPQGYFFLGGIQGYYGIHYYRVGGWLSAFSYAMSAVDNLNKANGMDPDLFDVYYGLGSYRYWKAVKAPFLYFFGRGRKEDRERGISDLMTAARKGVYSIYEARGALVRMLINENRHREAMHWLEETLEKYPSSLYAYRYRTEIHMEAENWQAALDDAARMEQLLALKVYSGPEAWVNALYMKGFSAMKLDKDREAAEAFRKCVEIGNRVKRHFKEYGPWVSKAKKYLKKLEK